MRRYILSAILSGGFALMASIAISQDAPTGRNASPAQRAQNTRTFLGLGPEPDKAAAERGAPLYQQSCSFCHGPQARGAEGPSLITSDVVLGDAHGESLVQFLKKGRPEKGMPGFPTVSDEQLNDISEFLHLQVEEVANRGTYQLKNIVVGNATEGKQYVDAHCVSCHKAGSFDHIGGKYRSADQLQHDWVWPNRPNDNSLAITADVKTADGNTISGRVTQISDFKITVVDSEGKTHAIERQPGVVVQVKDPLAPHQAMIKTLKNSDLHNVTAYLETLK
jgi:mono/diheme cytochrome c family protein